jgi:hypothetical protein
VPAGSASLKLNTVPLTGAPSVAAGGERLFSVRAASATVTFTLFELMSPLPVWATAEIVKLPSSKT